jgi:ion channel POLLUX/CASTOR
MSRRFSNRVKFLVERLMVRGAHYQLLVVAVVICLLSVVGGALVLIRGDSELDGLGAASWWAFLRLSDPGYLGEDTGTFKRAVSTALTVLGYVVFLGALVAIMTEWLQTTMRRLESGLTLVVRHGHVLIVGWTGRTASIVHHLLLSEGQVRRSLWHHGPGRLHIVILAESVRARLAQELRDRLGELWNPRQITLRSGSPLVAEHLERVDFLRASAIVIAAVDLVEDEPDTADAHAIKTLLSLSHHPGLARSGDLPMSVAEVFDVRNVPVAQRAYGGPVEILAIDALVSRLIAQTVRHRGLSHVYNELTQERGSGIHIREAPRLAGRRLQDLRDHFCDALVLGVVRPAGQSFQPLLNPSEPVTLERDDRLVLLARGDDVAEVDTAPAATAGEVPHHRLGRVAGPSQAARRVLILGWNHVVPALVAQLASYEGERFELAVVSSVPAARRTRELSRAQADLGRVAVDHIEADYTALPDLAQIGPASYDNIVLLARDEPRSGSETDVRTVLARLLLEELLGNEGRPRILVELLDARNVPLLGRRPGEIIVTPEILAYLLARVTLRRELRVVYKELFDAGGAEITFRTLARYDLPEGDYTFQRLREEACARGDTALGMFFASKGSDVEQLSLNPATSSRWRLTDQDQLVVLAQAD